jgi:hypothetical protein
MTHGCCIPLLHPALALRTASDIMRQTDIPGPHMKIVLEAFFAAMIAVASIAIAHAQSKPYELPSNLPKIVQDAIDENKKQCEEGEKPAVTQGFLTLKDINGDGKPDYILDYEHFQCGEFVTRFCGTGGCLTEIFASDGDGGYSPVWNENALRIRFTTIKKRPAMRIDLHGSVCGRFGPEACAMTLYWNGSKFHPAN